MTADELYTIEANEWKKIIEFYLSELDIFGERLEEVARKNTSRAIAASIESFENQFVVQKEALQKLRHEINHQQELLTADVRRAGVLADLDVVDEEFLLRDRMQTAEKILLELKHSFYRFLSKVL